LEQRKLLFRSIHIMLIGKHVQINSSQVVRIIEVTFQGRDRHGMISLQER